MVHGDPARDGRRGDPAELPALPLAQWRRTKDTLHLYCQIVGKVRLAVTSPRDRRRNVPLCVATRGLATNRMRYGGLGFAIDFDFMDHRLLIRTDVARSTSFGLHEGLSVSEFYTSLMDRLAELGARLTIDTEPVGIPGAPRHPDDTGHSAYDAAQVGRFWRVLCWTDGVFEEFASWFAGRTGPTHLLWHTFELAVTRYSGRRVLHSGAERDGDGPESTARETYVHEHIGFGFSPGDDRRFADASFYSYTYPEPPHLTRQPLLPEPATWIDTEGGGHLAVLGWEDVRTSPDPRRTLLTFLQSAYQAGGVSAGWEMADLDAIHGPRP